MAKKSKPSQKQSWIKKWQLWAVVGLIIVAGGLLWFWRQQAPPALPADYQPGSVTGCLAGPAFTAGLGLRQSGD